MSSAKRLKKISVRVALLALALLALNVGTAAAGFEVTTFDGEVTDELGGAETQAGAHPYQAFAQIDYAAIGDPAWFGIKIPDGGQPRSVAVELPPGLIGNPRATPVCHEAQVITSHCPLDSQVGTVQIQLDPQLIPETEGRGTIALYNMEPPQGRPAAFAFNIANNPIHLFPEVRAGDYGITVHADGIGQTLAVYGFKTTFWGVPAEPSHDSQRGQCLGGGSPIPNCSVAAEGPRVPFVSNPTSCTAPGVGLDTFLRTDSWGAPGQYVEKMFTSHLPAPEEDVAQGPTGCDQLEFEPTLEARPTTNVADAPSGLEVKLHFPQNDDPDGFVTAHLRDAVLNLPAGMTVNPSSANGLGACSPAQVGLVTPVGQPKAVFNGAAAACPDSSKLGTVAVESPLVDHTMKGALYLASQGQNPFGSLLALYMVIEDPKTGVTVKLAGQPVPDPQTGQLRVSFKQNPQLPFEDLEVDLFPGPGASLRTPVACGTFTTTSTLTPWSAPEGADANPSDSFEIGQGANGGDCVASDSQAPTRVSFSAGTADPAAGAYSPFNLRIVRDDGTQPLKAIDTTLPKGLLGRLAGIPYCPDAALAAAANRAGRDEQASPSCPATSQVGSVKVGAGAGATPFYADGKAYLAGPYKGGPLSLAIVTPAVAGPFDLGTVMVRVALKVDPETAQIRAVSDQIPTILQGIPLDIRSVALSMDKPKFTLNPTSCDRTAVLAGVTSVFDQAASLSSPFQVGGCGALGFKPKLALRFIGKTNRAAHPALRATLTMPEGGANISYAQVILPKTELLENAHIKTICTRVQYAALSCPAQSVYGYAQAWSPLLAEPLQGPVYLRSSDHELPDLVASLDGQIHLDLVGRIDSVNARIRNTFELIPDAPVSKFVLTMQGKKKGLLANNTNLCKAKPRATVLFDGQNGKAADSNPLVQTDCRKKGKKKRKPAHKRGARR